MYFSWVYLYYHHNHYKWMKSKNLWRTKILLKRFECWVKKKKEKMSNHVSKCLWSVKYISCTIGCINEGPIKYKSFNDFCSVNMFIKGIQCIVRICSTQNFINFMKFMWYIPITIARTTRRRRLIFSAKLTLNLSFFAKLV